MKNHKVVLVRHGVTLSNKEKRFTGATEESLSSEGLEQARLFAETVKTLNPDRVYSSPQERSLVTAKLATAQMDLPIKKDHNLREVNFGRWEGLTFEEIYQKDRDLAMGWAKGDRNFTFPEGENVRDFINRVGKFAECLTQFEEGTTLVFSHGGVIRHLLCHLLCLPSSSDRIFRIENVSPITIEICEGEAVLTGL